MSNYNIGLIKRDNKSNDLRSFEAINKANNLERNIWATAGIGLVGAAGLVYYLLNRIGKNKKLISDHINSISSIISTINGLNLSQMDTSITINSNAIANSNLRIEALEDIVKDYKSYILIMANNLEEINTKMDAVFVKLRNPSGSNPIPADMTNFNIASIITNIGPPNNAPQPLENDNDGDEVI